MSDVLNINDLAIGFPLSPHAVDGISFVVGRGKTVGLIGASGSGKSLTAWSLLGIQPEQALIKGNISLTHSDNRKTEIVSNGKMSRNHAGRLVSIVPQNPFTSLNPVLKCGFQVEECLRQKDLTAAGRKKTVEQLFAQMELEDPARIYHSYPFELSGGQLQRVLIAMAIAGDPEVLVADEPTTALDTLSQHQILKLLKQWIRHSGASLILISHDLMISTALCDVIYVMDEGKIIHVVDRESIQSMVDDPVIHRMLKDRPENLVRSGHATSKGKAILSIHGLSRQFVTKRDKRIVKAVDRVSLELHEGECLGLVGRSGSGKSTIGRILSGLIDADDGSIKYAGQTADPASLRKEIQMIFQDPYSALYPHRDVEYCIGEPLKLHHGLSGKAQRARVIDLLGQVTLPATFLKKRPAQLSGGERQRVQIARALAVEPRVLICDECVSGLDNDIQASILRLLMSVREQFDVAILFISHDLGVMRFLADRIAVISDGQIVEKGSWQQIFEYPKHEVTRALISASFE